MSSLHRDPDRVRHGVRRAVLRRARALRSDARRPPLRRAGPARRARGRRVVSRRAPSGAVPVRARGRADEFIFKFCEADPDTARDRAIYMAIYYLASSMAACRANLGVAVARRRAAWRQCAPLTWAAGAAWPHQAQRQVAGAIYSTSRLCRCMQR